MKPIDSLSDDEWSALVQRAVSMPDAPPELIQRALELWHLHRLPQRERPLPRRWIAVPSFDSWSGTPVSAGMRALPSEVRQLLFAAEAGDVDLRITPVVAGGFALSGQLLGPAAEGSVELAALGQDGGGPLPRSVAIDAMGEFRIEGVSCGTYQVTVHLGSDVLVLPPIDVGPPRDAGGP